MVAAVALMALVSCNKEVTPSEEIAPVGETVTFEASVDGADTKAVLDGTLSKWSGEELITILDGSNNYTFYTNATEPSTKAVFTYTGNFTASEVLAIYPSGNYTADIANQTASGINIPEKQILVDGSYAATSAIAIAYSTDRSLSFKNATTLLKFKVADENITKGAFYAVNGKGDLTGSFSLNYNGGEPTLASVDAKQWVDFELSNGAALSTDATYYLAVAPASFDEGFAISINGIEVKKYPSSYTLKRNVILDLGTLALPEASLNWSISGTFNEWGDTNMELEGDWFIARNVTITTSDRFKFRADQDWAQNRGTSSSVQNSTEYDVTQNGSDIYVAVSAIYDVYLSKDTNKMKIVKVGDYVNPNPDPTERTLYLKPGVWNQANAKFIAYTWKDGGSSKFVEVTQTTTSGVFSCAIPIEHTKVIFLRKSKATLDWNNEWNRVGDLTIPTDGKNCCEITGWSSSKWTTISM